MDQHAWFESKQGQTQTAQITDVLSQLEPFIKQCQACWRVRVSGARPGHQVLMRIEQLMFDHARLWQHRFLDTARNYTPLHLLMVAWAHCVCAQRYNQVAKEDPSALFRDLTILQRDWNSSSNCPQLLYGWFPTLRIRIARVIAFTYEHIEVADDIADGLGIDADAKEWLTTDTHANTENRAKVLETMDARDQPGTNIAIADASPQSIVRIALRVSLSLDTEVRFQQFHTQTAHWTGGRGQVLDLLNTLSGYMITADTDNIMRDIHLTRHLPLGALLQALSTCEGSVDRLSIQAVAESEIGAARIRALIDESVLPVKTALQSLTPTGAWSTLQETWLLALLNRMLTTHSRISLMKHYVILPQELCIKVDRWFVKERYGSVRSPLIVHALGRWCVSLCIEKHSVLLTCDTIADAVNCWAAVFAARGGVTLTGKPLKAWLMNVTTPESVAAATRLLSQPT